MVFPKRACPAVLLLFPVALLLCSFLGLVLRFARSAAQVHQNGPSLARLLFICLAVLLALSGCPFWPLSGPNPSKRTSQLSQSWFAWRCSLLFLVARLGKRAAEILQSRLAQLFFCFVSSFLLWLCFCAPFSLWYSVLSADPNPPKRTAPVSTLGLLACAPCSVGWSVLAS